MIEHRKWDDVCKMMECVVSVWLTFRRFVGASLIYLPVQKGKGSKLVLSVTIFRKKQKACVILFILKINLNKNIHIHNYIHAHI